MYAILLLLWLQESVHQRLARLTPLLLCLFILTLPKSSTDLLRSIVGSNGSIFVLVSQCTNLNSKSFELGGQVIDQCLSASDTSYCSDRASERISGDVGFRWTCSMYIVTCRLDGCSRQICQFPPSIESDQKGGNHGV